MAGPEQEAGHTYLHVTPAQIIALASSLVVFLLLLSANVAVCWLHRRVSNEGRRRDTRRARKKKKMSDVWVYQVHRPTPSPLPNPTPFPTPTTTPCLHEDVASQRILRHPPASLDNVRTSLGVEVGGARTAEEPDNVDREASRVLEELEVTAELYQQDTATTTSRATSRPSSLSCTNGDDNSSNKQDTATTTSRATSRPSFLSCTYGDHNDNNSSNNANHPSLAHDSSNTTAVFNDLGPEPPAQHTRGASPPAPSMTGLDTVMAPCSINHPDLSPPALVDLDLSPSALKDLDDVSLGSLGMEDFQNDPVMVTGRGREGRGRRGEGRRRRRSKRRSSSLDSVDPVFPVAEFHNDAFDFAECTTAVETGTEVDL